MESKQKILSGKMLPKELFIIGAGHIGMEMAEALAMAGMEVTNKLKESLILELWMTKLPK